LIDAPVNISSRDLPGSSLNIAARAANLLSGIVCLANEKSNGGFLAHARLALEALGPTRPRSTAVGYYGNGIDLSLRILKKAIKASLLVS
jgi:hypothetical protein